MSLSVIQMGVPVEIQLRTISMNMWASLEHEVSYKVNADLMPSYKTELKACADDLYAVEERMQKICRSIRACPNPQENGGTERADGTEGRASADIAGGAIPENGRAGA